MQSARSSYASAERRRGTEGIEDGAEWLAGAIEQEEAREFARGSVVRQRENQSPPPFSLSLLFLLLLLLPLRFALPCGRIRANID